MRPTPNLSSVVASLKKSFEEKKSASPRPWRKASSLLEDALEASQGRLAGQVVFKLYDTYGFPLDLTRLIAEERGVDLDEEGYHQAMEAQRAAGRAAWRGSGEEARMAIEGELSASTFEGYLLDESQHTLDQVF